MAGIRILLHFSFTNEGHLMNEQSSTEKYRERGNLNHTYIQLVREWAWERASYNEIRTRHDSFFCSFLVTFQKYIKTEWIDTQKRYIYTHLKVA